MKRNFYDLNLSDEIKEQIIAEAGGARIRVPLRFNEHKKIYKTFYNLKFPNHIKEQIVKEAGGIRLRIPPFMSKHNFIWTNKRNRLICQDCTNGYSNRALSKQFGLSERTIVRILKKSGITRGENRINDKDIKIMLDMKISKRKIAKKLSISPPTLYAHIKRGGLI